MELDRENLSLHGGLGVATRDFFEQGTHMGSTSLNGFKRYAAPTRITLSIAIGSVYVSGDNPAELEKRYFDSKVSLSAEIHLPDGVPPIRASQEATIGTVVTSIDALLASVSRIGVEIDEGV